MPQIKRAARRGHSSQGSTPFHVRCHCGESIEGYRRAEPQVLTCPSCGGSVFVLAESPLIPPKPIVRESQKEDRNAASPPPAGKWRGKNWRWRARVRLGSRRIAILHRRILSLRRFLTIPFLVGVAVTVSVVLTVGWQLHERREQRLVREADDAGRLGLAALESGDMTEAYRRLDAAARILRELDRPVAGRQSYLQAAAETELAVGFLGEPLWQLLSDAASIRGSGAQRITGRTVILAGVLKPNADGRIVLDAVGFFGDDAISADMESLGITRSAVFRPGESVLLGAKMDRVEKDGQGWRLVFSPSSGVWITHPAILAYLGIDDPEMRGVVARQRESLGLPNWRDGR